MYEATGTVSATVTGHQVTPPDQAFLASADRMQMYRYKGNIRVDATQIMGADPRTFNGFAFDMPNIRADGAPHVFKVPGEANAYYQANEQGSMQMYAVSTGELRVSLDSSQKLTGTFKFDASTGAGAAASVQVSQGSFELTSLTSEFARSAPIVQREMRGEVTGSPMPTQSFVAQEFQFAEGGFSPITPFWRITGVQYDNAIPRVRNIIGIQIDRDLLGNSFQLSGNRKVRVTYTRLGAFGITQATEGTLTLTSLPTTGRITGTLNCLAPGRAGPPISIVLSFDIPRHV